MAPWAASAALQGDGGGYAHYNLPHRHRYRGRARMCACVRVRTRACVRPRSLAYTYLALHGPECGPIAKQSNANDEFLTYLYTRTTHMRELMRRLRVPRRDDSLYETTPEKGEGKRVPVFRPAKRGSFYNPFLGKGGNGSKRPHNEAISPFPVKKGRGKKDHNKRPQSTFYRVS